MLGTEQVMTDELRQMNAETVRRFIDAINDSWNIDLLRELISEDFLFVIPFAPEWFQVRYEGKEKALAFLDTVRELMDPENLHDLRINSFAEDPNQIVVQYKSATRMKKTAVLQRLHWTLHCPKRKDYVLR